MRSRPYLILVALLACVGTLLVGCSDDDSADGELLTLLSRAAERTGSVDTVRTRFEMRFVDVPNVPSQPTVTDMVTTMDGMLGYGTYSEAGQKVDAIVADEAYYYAFPNLPGGAKWARVTFTELERLTGLDVSASANQSPTETLKRLQASGKVEDVGGEEIDGVDTTHYRATVDIDAMAQFGGMSDDLLEQTRGLMGDTYDLDVWVDADGYVRRMTWFVDLSASPDLPVGMPDEGEIHYTITMSDFGAPVDVSAPPESQVVDIRDLN